MRDSSSKLMDILSIAEEESNEFYKEGKGVEVAQCLIIELTWSDLYRAKQTILKQIS